MIKKMSVLAVLTILSGCASSPPKTPDAEQQTKTPQALVDQGYAYLKVSKIKQLLLSSMQLSSCVRISGRMKNRFIQRERL